MLSASLPINMAHMRNELLKKYGGPVPRYTSYPTAPQMTSDIDGDVVLQWVSELPNDEPISLYCHIPFCDSLCWFCGCHTKVTNRAENSDGPVSRYVALMEQELLTLAAAASKGANNPPSTARIHWGGGSPTILTPDLITRLSAAIDNAFPIAEGRVFSVEIDPRGVDLDRMEALAAAGVNRISIGVQDFDPAVQTAINRRQSFDETERVVSGMRERGVESINIDLIYGLPFQTSGTIDATIDQVMRLAPDRISLFGYAHVPWMKKHQALIDTDTLPDQENRAIMATQAAKLLCKAGYEQIGIDHFALPKDRLVALRDTGQLRRNFQGYTDDPTKTLLGCGVSAISRFSSGLAQNETELPAYRRHVLAGEPPIARGCRTNKHDRLRAAIIEKLMCNFAVDLRQILNDMNSDSKEIEADIDRLSPLVRDGLVTLSEGLILSITDLGRPYTRQVAACFDEYLPRAKGRHSMTV